MRKWALRLALLVAGLAAVWGLRATVFARAPLEVEVIDVERGRVEETVTNSRAGTVTARRRAKLSPEVGGEVLRLPYREGDTVTAGEVLLELDRRSQQARLTLSRREHEAVAAERRRACLAADRATRELERFRRLAADQIVSEDLLDRAETTQAETEAACAAARAQEARAQAAVVLAQAEVDKTVVRAPFDGVVAEVSIEVGEWTTPSPPALPVPPVIDILDPGSIYVSAPMDEVDSARIRPGQPARVTVDSHRDRELTGRVVRVAPYVLDLQEQNRTVEIEVDLDDHELSATLLPGTSADVEIILASEDDVLRVPTSALIEGRAVLVLAAGVLVERQVVTGSRNWNFTEIESGLAEGDRVVTSLDREEIQAGAEAVARDGEDGG